MAAGKIALVGLSRVRMFPVEQNDLEGYRVGDALSIPEIQGMSKSANVDSETIFADDGIYMEITSWNGLELELTFAEMAHQMVAALGFGEYDPMTKELKGRPQGSAKEFALTFRAKLANGNYRMFRMYTFAVSEVGAASLQTQGGGVNIAPYAIRGIVKRRAFDDEFFVEKDSESADELVWLESVPESPEA